MIGGLKTLFAYFFTFAFIFDPIPTLNKRYCSINIKKRYQNNLSIKREVFSPQTHYA